MELLQDLAKLTDAEAERCLKHVVAAYSAQKGYDFKKLVAQETDMAAAVAATATEVDVAIPSVAEVASAKKPAALRVVLVEMAAIPELSDHIRSWIESDRKTLLDPLTSALVLAGLVVILSVEVDIKYKDENGKRTIAVHVKKKPTSQRILQKIASFF